jgi:hypothetical protein
MGGGERLDLHGWPLPPGLEVRVVVLPPGDRLSYEPAVWRGVLLEVDCGEIDIVFRSGVCGRLIAGTLFRLDGLAPQALHNPGHQPAVLLAVCPVGAILATKTRPQRTRETREHPRPRLDSGLGVSSGLRSHDTERAGGSSGRVSDRRPT